VNWANTYIKAADEDPERICMYLEHLSALHKTKPNILTLLKVGIASSFLRRDKCASKLTVVLLTAQILARQRSHRGSSNPTAPKPSQPRTMQEPAPTKTEATKPDAPTQQSRYPLRSACRMEASSSPFRVHASQIAPLPSFSPLRFPEPTASDFTQDLHEAPLSSKHDEPSPLTSRAKRRDMDPGKAYILSQSILRPRQPLDPTRPQSSQSDQQDKGSSGLYGKNQTPNRPKFHPSRLLGPNPTSKSPFATRFKSPLAIAVTADESVYMTPDTSLIDENQEQLPDSPAKNHALVSHGQPTSQDSDHDNVKNQIATIIPGQTHLSSEWEANLFSRYRILHSFVFFCSWFHPPPPPPKKKKNRD
jgi:hypothetical protein